MPKFDPSQDIADFMKTGSVSPEMRQQFNRQVNQQELNQLLSSLSPDQSKKLEQILSDKTAAQRLLSTPQARALFQKLMGK